MFSHLIVGIMGKEHGISELKGEKSVLGQTGFFSSFVSVK